MNVLIVENDFSLLDTMREICHDEGFVVKTAAEVQDARNLLQSGYLPAIIFCDQFIPSLKGRMFQVELLEDDRFRNIPFVIMESYRQKDIKNIDGEKKLIKPFSMEQFVKLLNDVRLSSQIRT